jgi:hypothetical protein
MINNQGIISESSHARSTPQLFKCLMRSTSTRRLVLWYCPQERQGSLQRPFPYYMVIRAAGSPPCPSMAGVPSGEEIAWALWWVVSRHRYKLAPNIESQISLGTMVCYSCIQIKPHRAGWVMVVVHRHYEDVVLLIEQQQLGGGGLRVACLLRFWSRYGWEIWEKRRHAAARYYIYVICTTGYM